MGTTVGIDLGTTNSCIAIVKGGATQVLADERGDSICPSVVAFTETGAILVGEAARRQAASNPEYTIAAAKRLIGRSFDSDETKKSIAALAYYCKAGPQGDVRIVIRGRDFSLPEISAYVLRHMKAYAEARLGEPVERAVITVPAYFNDHQRQATKDAGALANLEVLRIINEPTAAALAAGLAKQDLTVAVYDLGGGTFDLSVLDIEHGVFEVVASGGDSFLGGLDFDNRIVDHLARQFEAAEKLEVRSNARSMQRLRDAAEKAKIDLSARTSTQVYLPFFHRVGERTLHLSASLERAQLEELTRDLVERTLDISRQVLREAALEPRELDMVLLIGGMTRMPAVRAAAARFFGRDPVTSVDPDRAVAMGAAIQGDIIVHEGREAVLLDVTSQDLGIQVLGGLHEVLIHRNTTIPTSERKVFHTVRDDQTEVRIVVLQGTHKRAEHNEVLGEFTLTGLRRARRGEVAIEVTFAINADGIVSVSARDQATGQQQGITVNAHTGLGPDELAAMRARAQDNLPTSPMAEAYERLRRESEDLLYRIDRLIGELSAMLGVEQAMDHPVLAAAVTAVGQARAAMERRDQAEMEVQLDGLRRSYQLLQDTWGQFQTAIIPAPGAPDLGRT